MELIKEYETYIAAKNKLVSDGHIGKFIVIKGEEIFDIFISYEDALRQGLKKFGNTPFLIKEINAVEEVNFFYHGLDLDSCQASV